MKLFLFFVAFIFSLVTKAQVTRVSLQASGLTCSMCSNSIFKSLKTISFIDNINANIKTSTFEITFKPGSHVEFDKLKEKVEDAGYSVAKFVATIQCADVRVSGNEPVNIGNIRFQFFNTEDQLLNGEKQVRIVNKGFVPAKEFKKSSFGTVGQPGVYYAVI